jgi:hypothetical protein
MTRSCAPAACASPCEHVPARGVSGGWGHASVVPDFAKAMGHEEQSKLHNNCN